MTYAPALNCIKYSVGIERIIQKLEENLELTEKQ